jgi:hypothetical protein
MKSRSNGFLRISKLKNALPGIFEKCPQAYKYLDRINRMFRFFATLQMKVAKPNSLQQERNSSKETIID